LLGALGISGGASVGSISGGIVLSEGFGELLVAECSPSAMVNLVIRAAVNHNLPLYESMERAVAQYEAVGGDHLALRRTLNKLVAHSAAGTPEEQSGSADSE
jgi:hypothetical protein